MLAYLESPLSLRPATPDDAEPASALIYDTMGTLGDYLLGGSNREETVRLLALLFREGGHLLSFQFSTLAELEGKVIGIAQAVPESDLSKVTIQLVRASAKCFGLRAALRLAWRGFPLAFEGDSEPGEYYVNTLAVESAHRNRGAGRALLADAERRAREKNISTLSLSVMLQNADALRFYQRVGFRMDRKVISRLRVPGVQYNGFYRMIKPVKEQAAAVDEKVQR